MRSTAAPSPRRTEEFRLEEPVRKSEALLSALLPQYSLRGQHHWRGWWVPAITAGVGQTSSIASRHQGVQLHCRGQWGPRRIWVGAATSQQEPGGWMPSSTAGARQATHMRREPLHWGRVDLGARNPTDRQTLSPEWLSPW
ncbi:hypothetical protein NDU88_004064 [Pleurodeles waltl]|uniref:Uncharacterized protein n=1 Tax=Pleurodeles waltl TaxID=8319 RepID=A0AAV7NIH3_PLEWA|nr:hypothetical protein NDU88_004064 [Pleurodeles waltl]